MILKLYHHGPGDNKA